MFYTFAPTNLFMKNQIHQSNFNMKTIRINLLFFTFLSLFILSSCSKDDNIVKEDSIVGIYNLAKKGIVKNGKFIEEDKNDEEYRNITGELTFLEDNSFRIVWYEDDDMFIDIGVYNTSNKTIRIKRGEDYSSSYEYYNDGKYLVIVTEYNDGYKNVAYFLKK